MAKLTSVQSGQLAFDAFAEGSVVKLDGGQRLRLDGKVDFWPGSGAWKSLVSDASGHGATTMLDFLVAQRQAEGRGPQQAAVKTQRKVYCNHCGKPAGLYTGEVVHPGRGDLAHRLFWACWPCDAWVACHQRGDGTQPLGSLAKPPVRNARRAAHAAFDPIWQGGEMDRVSAYAWLSKATGIPHLHCHIGHMDEAQCRMVIDAVNARHGGWEDGTLGVRANGGPDV